MLGIARGASYNDIILVEFTVIITIFIIGDNKALDRIIHKVVVNPIFILGHLRIVLPGTGKSFVAMIPRMDIRYVF